MQVAAAASFGWHMLVPLLTRRSAAIQMRQSNADRTVTTGMEFVGVTRAVVV